MKNPNEKIFWIIVLILVVSVFTLWSATINLRKTSLQVGQRILKSHQLIRNLKAQLEQIR